MGLDKDKEKKKKLEANSKLISGMLNEPGNNRCADCAKKGCSHASINIGAFLCANCAQIHQNFGKKIKSIEKESWSDESISAMLKGGNKRINTKYNIGVAPTSDLIELAEFIRIKYNIDTVGTTAAPHKKEVKFHVDPLQSVRHSENEFKKELVTLENMGFSDKEANLIALSKTKGVMDAAIEILCGKRQKSSNKVVSSSLSVSQEGNFPSNQLNELCLQLNKIGFKDNEINKKVLLETNGNLQSAVEIMMEKFFQQKKREQNINYSQKVNLPIENFVAEGANTNFTSSQYTQHQNFTTIPPKMNPIQQIPFQQDIWNQSNNQFNQQQFQNEYTLQNYNQFQQNSNQQYFHFSNQANIPSQISQFGASSSQQFSIQSKQDLQRQEQVQLVEQNRYDTQRKEQIRLHEQQRQQEQLRLEQQKQEELIYEAERKERIRLQEVQRQQEELKIEQRKQEQMRIEMAFVEKQRLEQLMLQQQFSISPSTNSQIPNVNEFNISFSGEVPEVKPQQHKNNHILSLYNQPQGKVQPNYVSISNNPNSAYGVEGFSNVNSVSFAGTTNPYPGAIINNSMGSFGNGGIGYSNNNSSNSLPGLNIGKGLNVGNGIKISSSGMFGNLLTTDQQPVKSQAGNAANLFAGSSTNPFAKSNDSLGNNQRNPFLN
ncbi:hypothetical protein HK099_005525, partial [Clydaea vesicula]